ncbi:hypothetical protein PJL18_04407 [Paenarthrobacter nicotinovorans]|nr:hypothetical protein [Paenarthrobacter nicotinovorans]
MPQQAAQEHHADHDGQDVAQHVQDGDRVDDLADGEELDEEGTHNVDDGQPQLDIQGRTGVLVGVEHAGHHEVCAQERGAQGKDGECLRQHHAVLPFTTGEEHAQRPRQCEQRQGAEDRGNSHGAETMREGVAKLGFVAVLRSACHAVEEDRGQGQSDDRVRQQVQLAGHLQDGVAWQDSGSRPVSGVVQAEACPLYTYEAADVRD